MFGRIGIQELILILALALIIFGPRKLPEIGRSIGQGLREFKKATTEIQKSVTLEDNELEKMQPSNDNKSVADKVEGEVEKA